MVVRLLTKTQLGSILSVSSLYSFNFRTVVQNILILKALLARWTKDSFSHAYFHVLRSIRHHNKLATTKLTTTKSQITTGSDLTQTLCSLSCETKIKWKLRCSNTLRKGKYNSEVMFSLSIMTPSNFRRVIFAPMFMKPYETCIK